MFFLLILCSHFCEFLFRSQDYVLKPHVRKLRRKRRHRRLRHVARKIAQQRPKSPLTVESTNDVVGNLVESSGDGELHEVMRVIQQQGVRCARFCNE